MSSAAYTPIDRFPDFSGAAGNGPVELQGDNDPLLYALTFRNDVALSSVENTTPIRVNTTTTLAPLATGDFVTIVGSDVAAANGSFEVTVITPQKFELQGTTASGVGTAVGRVALAKAGTLAQLIDAVTWLAKSFATVYTASFTDATENGSVYQTISAATWTDITATAVDIGVDAKIGDLVEIAFCTNALFDDNGAPTHAGFVRLRVIQDFGGAATAVNIVGAQAYILGAVTESHQVSLIGDLTVAVAGPLRVIAQAQVKDVGQTLELLEAFRMRVTHIRKGG